jgi:transcriptional regulator with XRE-family HTH domain
MRYGLKEVNPFGKKIAECAYLATSTMSDMRSTADNALAGSYLKQARLGLGRSQGEFAQDLTAALGLEVGQSSLSNYETARRLIPAAVIIAAFRLSGLPFANAQAERALGEWMASVTEEQREQRSELRTLRRLIERRLADPS